MISYKTKDFDDGYDDLDDFEGGEYQAPDSSQQSIPFEELLKQAFTLVFKDEYITFGNAVSNVFNNKVNESIDTRNFLRNKDDLSVLKLKNDIFQSLKLAFHMGNSKVFEMETDIKEGMQLEVS